jgi:hypothetical protein
MEVELTGRQSMWCSAVGGIEVNCATRELPRLAISLADPEEEGEAEQIVGIAECINKVDKPAGIFAARPS